MATVMLCGVRPLQAEGLRRILNNVLDLKLVDSCPGLADLHEQIKIIQPDILMVEMAREVTFSALRGLREAVPTLKIVLWVDEISLELALQSMSLGVRGIIRMAVPVETLLRCLMRVREGELWIDKTLTDSIMTAGSYSPTRWQDHLIALLAQAQLNISEGTVRV
jgi:DNA-binding NarL/FixJ family response regulator